MGGGASRYKKQDDQEAEDENGYNNWRKPKLQKALSAPPPSKGRAQASSAGAKAPGPALPPLPANRNHEQLASSTLARGPGPALPGPKAVVRRPANVEVYAGAGPISPVTRGSAAFASDEDDDEDLAQFANLAAAADQVWDQLMDQKNTTQEFGSLMVLAELKDAVARTAMRLECLQRELGSLQEKTDAKMARLTELCTSAEKAPPSYNVDALWKLGDLTVRRGKGLCELTDIHHDSDPPYFEVRMSITGDIVGTEAAKLVQLSVPQQGHMRMALREYQQASSSAVAVEASVEQASRELQQQHQSLAERVEQKIQDPAKNTAGGGKPQSMPGPPLPARTTPSGMPDFSLMKRWGNSPNSSGVAGSTIGSAHSAQYPEVRGSREDLRVHGGFSGKAAPPPDDALSQTTSSQPSGLAAPPGMPTVEAFPRKGGDAKTPAGLPPMGPRPKAASKRLAAQAEQSAARADQQEQYQRKHELQQQQQQQQRQQEQLRQQQQEQQRQRMQQQQQEQEQQQEQQPEGDVWVVYRSPEGHFYYHNEQTNQTVWNLPPGARCIQPGEARPSQRSQGQAAATDAWAEQLRQQEAEREQQREHWAQWYSQYCQWYQSQQQAAHQAYAQHYANASQGGQHWQQQQQQQQQASSIPKGPAPPTIDASREDQAIFAIKSSLLKEMETMVREGAPVAQRKKALRCLQIKWHPDKNPDKSEAAKSVFQFIEETKGWFLHDPESENG